MDVPCSGAGEVIAGREVNRPASRDTAAFGVVDILVAGKTAEHGLHSAPSTASEWTAYDAVRFGVDMPKDIPMVHQERAYTSAIWHTP
jgi:hypothetical protein